MKEKQTAMAARLLGITLGVAQQAAGGPSTSDQQIKTIDFDRARVWDPDRYGWYSR